MNNFHEKITTCLTADRIFIRSYGLGCFSIYVNIEFW